MSNKKIMLILNFAVLLILVGWICCDLYKEFSYNKRYEEIKNDVNKELERYLYVVSPKCKNSSMKITHKTLVYNGGMNKDTFLDVDGKSYCKLYVKANCIYEGIWNWNTYISCDDYEDEGYVNWDDEFESKE